MLTTTDCDAALDADAFLHGPIPQALKAANKVLDALGYPLYNRRRILGVLARQGTAQCCPLICEKHRDAVEAVLPGVNPWQWDASVDAWRWELGAETTLTMKGA